MSTDAALQERVEGLRVELASAGATFVAAVLELVPAAEELARLECALRAAEHRAGRTHDGRPPARELATEVLLGQLQALSPYLRPQGTRAAAERAAEALSSRPKDRS